ncbi:MAG: hypothetical protein JWQ81_2038 [Amycolatopsis sp.]|jgi:hypothetical protein|uniref:DUF4383 domain-containing protein n=1 Tax=Amycolatopsis sp. TaxID=37632 RepID=UPI002604D3AA|nr:DUF4383 domain-containing protein [Amycolatopsis sp.]MCU1681299.1 hypothetical protein [Amycolatopsis sp.]
MTRSDVGRIRVAGLQPVQVLAGLAGLVLLAAGIFGYLKTGFDGDRLFWHGFSINPMHNLLHVVAGVLGLLAATGSGRSRLFGWLMFAGFGLLFVWGLMLNGALSTNVVSGWGNPLELNTADNWANLGVAVVGLIVAMMPARKQIRVPEAETTEPETTETAGTVNTKDSYINPALARGEAPDDRIDGVDRIPDGGSALTEEDRVGHRHHGVGQGGVNAT